MNKDLIITKASGETARFSEEKLRSSLHRSGATEEQISHVINEISDKLYEGIPTRKIYSLAFKLLRDSSRPVAAKYHLKRAIMELGPSGYPFEKYVGAIMKHQGFDVAVGTIVPGTCVQHEVDIVAKMDHHQRMVECKYHNLQGIICDVKIPLYIHSRFKDVESEWIKSQGDKQLSYEGWVVTNTRFSNDAIQYGTCAGLKLLGWDYPAKGSLRDLIDTLGLYPITCLTSLTKGEKQYLLDKKIVLSHELCDNEPLVTEAGVRSSRIASVLQEAQQLCSLAKPISN